MKIEQLLTYLTVPSDKREQFIFLQGQLGCPSFTYVAQYIPADIEKIDLSRSQALLDPLFPLLPEIRDNLVARFSSNEIARMIQSTSVSPLHTARFARYILDDQTLPLEPDILDEDHFRQELLFQNVWILLQQLKSDGKAVYYLGAAHSLPYSTLHFLQWVAHTNPESDMTFLVYSSGSAIQACSDEWQEGWNALFDAAHLGSVALILEDESVDILPEMVLPSPSHTNIQQLLNFSCWQDAAAGMDILLQQYNAGKLVLDPAQYVELLCSKARALLHAGEINPAIDCAQAAHNTNCTSVGHAVQSEILRLLSHLSYIKNQSRAAMRYAGQAYRIAVEHADNQAEVQSLFLFLLIDARENSLQQEAWESYFHRFAELCTELGWKNYQSYWLARPDRFDPVAQAEIVDNFQQQCTLAVSALWLEVIMLR